MKKRSILIFLLLMVALFTGCSLLAGQPSNSITITKADEKTIEEYINTKTDDISSAREGKMYSAFALLGSDKDRIYLWVLKEEFVKAGDRIVQQNGVSLPVVLYVKDTGNGIEIKNHKYPEDGEGYGKSLKKLFPESVINIISKNHNERVTKLEETIKSLAKDDLKI